MASKPAPKKVPPKATKPAARKKAVGAAVSTSKSGADWERIELDYRAGIKTLRQIADEHGISHVAVAKRAKRDGWTRDLAGKIQAKADELVNKSLVTSAVTAQTKIAEKSVIDANAQAVADIRLAHRSDIRRARNLTNSLLAELEAQTDPSTLAMLHELMQRAGRISTWSPRENPKLCEMHAQGQMRWERARPREGCTW